MMLRGGGGGGGGEWSLLVATKALTVRVSPFCKRFRVLKLTNINAVISILGFHVTS